MMLGEALRTEWIENPRIGGSIPPPGTTFKNDTQILRSDLRLVRLTEDVLG